MWESQGNPNYLPFIEKYTDDQEAIPLVQVTVVSGPQYWDLGTLGYALRYRTVSIVFQYIFQYIIDVEVLKMLHC